MSGDPQEQQPSDEQMRAYVEQLRAADPSEIVAQAFAMLGTGAQTKLGRPDARVLIDAAQAMVDALEGRLPDQLAQGMRNDLSQLQQAQVQSESEAGAAPEQQAGQSDLGAAPGGGDAASGQGGEQSSEQSGQRAADRLWIPGQ
ncbi:hypothetical protein ER308_19595 [Egibacter rhizosphaerae]|uniref:Uncharacterized protein n=1 Tax=Egibacter rhizosphaerae TaxID=1670831 RepID=A0A411YK37_9ACTN|nr:hypothetical protein [Egibacter rhizosphaerae]QBI21555.1 hypothetical protein ER308_19595 [Egibacter rhizosphaerae]